MERVTRDSKRLDLEGEPDVRLAYPWPRAWGGCLRPGAVGRRVGLVGWKAACLGNRELSA